MWCSRAQHCIIATLCVFVVLIRVHTCAISKENHYAALYCGSNHSSFGVGGDYEVNGIRDDYDDGAVWITMHLVDNDLASD